MLIYNKKNIADQCVFRKGWVIDCFKVFKKFIEILPESRWFPAGKDWVKIAYL